MGGLSQVWQAVAVSAIVQVVVLGLVPFAAYYLFQRFRHGRSLAQAAARVGLQRSAPKFVAWSLLPAAVGVALLGIFWPTIAVHVTEGTAQGQFLGLGLEPGTIAAAFLFGMLQTGFTEELLFRGFIAGALSRRLPTAWANAAQGFVFLLPHVPLVWIAPAMWGLLPIVYIIALGFGWVRIQSGSIVGPWLGHGLINTATALLAAGLG